MSLTRMSALTLLLAGFLLTLTVDPALARPGKKEKGKHKGQEKQAQKLSPKHAQKQHREFVYDYYPNLKVYHNRTTDTFFWIDNGRWCQARQKPSHIALGGSRKRIRMGGETPFEYHQVNYERLPYGKPEKKFGKRRGPPDHAPAWGLRRKQEYVYYPDHKVYYHPQTEQYLWLEKDKVKLGVELPSWIKVDPINGVTVDIDRDLNLNDFKGIFMKEQTP